MTDTAPDAASLEARVTEFRRLEEQISREYSDPDEAKAALATIADSMGFDPATGVPADIGAAEEASAQAAREAAAQATGTLTDETAALKAQNDEMATELAQRQLAEEIRGEVSAAVQEKIAEYEKLAEAENKKLREFEAEYGEEAGETLREQIEANRQHRNQELESFQAAMIAKAQAEKSAEFEDRSALERDIDAIPEFKQWRADAIAAHRGDESKAEAAKAYNAAVAIDKALRDSGEWDNRPRQERFEKVVQMVKLAQGGTAARIDGLIAQKGATGDMPGSLTDIPGGVTGPAPGLQKLEAMSAAELGDAFDMDPNAVSKIDALLERHLVAAGED